MPSFLIKVILGADEMQKYTTRQLSNQRKYKNKNMCLNPELNELSKLGYLKVFLDNKGIQGILFQDERMMQSWNHWGQFLFMDTTSH